MAVMKTRHAENRTFNRARKERALNKDPHLRRSGASSRLQGEGKQSRRCSLQRDAKTQLANRFRYCSHIGRSGSRVRATRPCLKIQVLTSMQVEEASSLPGRERMKVRVLIQRAILFALDLRF
jgi:hypothetical protein